MEKPPRQCCTILGCQIEVPLTRNQSRMRQHVDCLVENLCGRLSGRRADLVVLPELSTIEYSRESFDQLPQLAEDLGGYCVTQLGNLAKTFGTTITFGMPRAEAGRYYISQVVLDPEGEVTGCYDKLHICQFGASMEKEYFDRGQSLCIFEVNDIRFAPIICYDIRIPELSEH